MPVSVGIFTAQMLQDAHLTDIGAQRKQSTPTDAADAEIGQNALATLRVSNQQSAGASDRNDSAHQGEWERRSGPRPGCDPVAITPILEHAAPELLALVADDVFRGGTGGVNGTFEEVRHRYGWGRLAVGPQNAVTGQVIACRHPQ